MNFKLFITSFFFFSTTALFASEIGEEEFTRQDTTPHYVEFNPDHIQAAEGEQNFTDTEPSAVAEVESALNSLLEPLRISLESNQKYWEILQKFEELKGGDFTSAIVFETKLVLTSQMVLLVLEASNNPYLLCLRSSFLFLELPAKFLLTSIVKSLKFATWS